MTNLTEFDRNTQLAFIKNRLKDSVKKLQEVKYEINSVDNLKLSFQCALNFSLEGLVARIDSLTEDDLAFDDELDMKINFVDSFNDVMDNVGEGNV